jgi:predicted metal-binding protein
MVRPRVREISQTRPLTRQPGPLRDQADGDRRTRTSGTNRRGHHRAAPGPRTHSGDQTAVPGRSARQGADREPSRRATLLRPTGIRPAPHARRVCGRFEGDLRVGSLTGCSGCLSLVATVHFRRVSRAANGLHLLTCMLLPGTDGCNQNSAATIGNALTLQFDVYPQTAK